MISHTPSHSLIAQELSTPTVTRIIQAHIVRRVQSQTKATSIAWQHLLLRRSATQSRFPDMWQVITGTIEPNETPLQTAFREIEEEAGLRVGELWVLPHVGMFYDAVRNAMNLVPCFAAVLSDEDSSTADVILSDEHSAFEWCSSLRAEEQLVIPSHLHGVETLERHILPLLQRGETPVFARHSRAEAF
jgi:8-oxo-dGTP pyrophosphatase MutT (NUDIX family)